MGSVYWDTSAVIKLYADEADSSAYRQALLLQRGSISISSLHRTEMYFALRSKTQRGELPKNADRAAFGFFLEHLEAGRYHSIPIGTEAEEAARSILDTCIEQYPSILLRSLDGLHLGAMKTASIPSLMTADRRMAEAARAASLGVVDV